MFFYRCSFLAKLRDSLKWQICLDSVYLGLALGMFLLSTGGALAEEGKEGTPNSAYYQPQTGLKLELLLQEEPEPYLYLHFQLPSGTHIYGEDPGPLGLPTTVEWDLPPGCSAGPLEWPEPKLFQTQGLSSYGYEESFYLKAKLYLDVQDLEKPLSIGVESTWILCGEDCVPGEAYLRLDLSPTTVAHILIKQANAQPLLAKTRKPQKPLASILALAFLGGILLNAMPCVFPVLGLKVLSFAKGQESSSLTVKLQALSFAAGILVSFWALSSILIALRASGEALGWGFQLQSPFFVFLLIVLFFIMGLNFLNVFPFGASWMGIGGHLGQTGGYGASFLSGVLTCMVAAPCSGPFIGTALGVALTQAGLTSFLIFSALGVGLALPYVLLSFWPPLLRLLPKPGPWMETLKESMAFPLFGTVLWLLWVLGQQKGLACVMISLWILLFTGLGAWWYGKNGCQSPKRLIHLGIFLLFLGVAIFAGYKTVQETPINAAISWLPYSEAKLEALLAEGRPVFIDFTASWCLTCQLNKRSVLDNTNVQSAFKAKHVVLLRADWTHKDPSIAQKLESFGRSGVPFNVLYTQNPEKPLWLFPTLLTQEEIFKALEAIGPKEKS